MLYEAGLSALFLLSSQLLGLEVKNAVVEALLSGVEEILSLGLEVDALLEIGVHNLLFR